MADIGFDLNDLLSSPTFQAGANLLANPWLPVGQNIQQGLQNAQSAQMNPIQRQLAQLQLQKAQNLANFNPQNFVSGGQQQVAGPATQAAAQQMGLPQGAAPASTGDIGTGQSIDMPGLVTAGIQAGMNPQDIMSIAQATNPGYFARMQALAKLMEPQKLGPSEQLVIPYNAMTGQGQPGSNGVVAANTNPPADSKAAQIQMLSRLRDQYQPGTPQYQQYNAALNEVSGAYQQSRGDAMLGIANANLGLHRETVEGNPQDIETTAQAIANYQTAPLNGFSMRSPQGQRVMARVMEINPQYSAQNYASSQKAVNDFSTGKNGNTVRSISVAMDHLGTLSNLADALGNGDVKMINQLSQAVAAQTGHSAPNNFDTAKTIVGDEIVKAIVGAGGGVSDRQEAQSVLDKANSPQQLQGVIQTYQKLLGGQLGGLQRQYEQTTMRKDFNRFLSPAAQGLMGGPAKTVVRSGMANGRRVYQYSDGSTAYADGGQ